MAQKIGPPVQHADPPRLQRLRDLQAGGYEERVRAELAAVWRRKGGAPLRLRPSFVELAQPLRGPVSDRKVRQLVRRPPLAKLVAPRGVALQAFLIALLQAQGTTKRGHAPANVLSIEPEGEADRSWSDLLAVHTMGGRDNRRRKVADRDNRVRQIKRALARLERDDVRLVELALSSGSHGRYERFRLLHESGSPKRPVPIKYTVPAPTEIAFDIPKDFFLQGWVHVLEDREIAAYLVLCQRGAQAFRIEWSPDERLRNYGLPRTTYESFATLERFGLVEAFVDPNRRDNGQIVGHSEGEVAAANAWQLTDGVSATAIDVVLKQLPA